MVALALLGLGLIVLIKSAAGNISSSEQAHMMGIATDLARGKMYDIEEKLLKDGFTDTDSREDRSKPFDDEGWPNDLLLLQGRAGRAAELRPAEGDGAGPRARAGGSGSILRLGVRQRVGSASRLRRARRVPEQRARRHARHVRRRRAAARRRGRRHGRRVVIQSQYSMFQEILKVSIRKVTLTVSWKVDGQRQRDEVVAFFTDPAAMDKVLNGLGSQELPDSDRARARAAARAAAAGRRRQPQHGSGTK